MIVRQLRARRRRPAHARPPARLRRRAGRAPALVRLLGRVLGPLATLLILIGNAITPGRGFRDGPFSSEVELRELVDMAEERGVVEAGERKMIHSVFELGDTIAREVMVPRTDVVWIERTKTVRAGAGARAAQRVLAGIPVIGENVDDVVGVVYLKDLVRRVAGPPTAPARAARRGADAPADLRAGVQAGRRAAARDAGRSASTSRSWSTSTAAPPGWSRSRTSSRRSSARSPTSTTSSGRRSRSSTTAPMRVTARLPVEDLAELFDVELPEDDDVETVGGLLAEALGRVPIAGAAAEVGGLRAGRRERRRPAQPHRHGAGLPRARADDEAAERAPTSAGRAPPGRGAGAVEG